LMNHQHRLCASNLVWSKHLKWPSHRRRVSCSPSTLHRTRRSDHRLPIQHLEAQPRSLESGDQARPRHLILLRLGLNGGRDWTRTRVNGRRSWSRRHVLELSLTIVLAPSMTRSSCQGKKRQGDNDQRVPSIRQAHTHHRSHRHPIRRPRSHGSTWAQQNKSSPRFHRSPL